MYIAVTSRHCATATIGAIYDGQSVLEYAKDAFYPAVECIDASTQCYIFLSFLSLSLACVYAVGWVLLHNQPVLQEEQ